MSTPRRLVSFVFLGIVAAFSFLSPAGAIVHGAPPNGSRGLPAEGIVLNLDPSGGVDLPTSVGLMNPVRNVIAGDIVHYSFQVQIGPGPYDRIGLHRVVKERTPFEPIRTRDGLFIIPGGWYRFDKLFLASLDDPNIPDTHAFPVFLAQNNYDVWGIDLAWSLVPAGLDDYSFMSSWGMEKDARDTRIGLAVARATRAVTGSGSGPLNLLGYSIGYMVGFVAVEQETRIPSALRQIKGYVPVDGYFDCEACSEYACALLAYEMDQMNAGVHVDASGELLSALGALAATAPGEESPILPGLTNLQAALLFTTQTWQVGPENPHYHLFAPVVDETGFPTDTQYTTVGYVFNFLQNASYSLPLREYADWNEVLCAQTDSPLDDHLGDITVPIFYVASAGGTGSYGLPTLSLLGSNDVKYYIAQLWPAGQETMDFGHVDLWLATNAPDVAWRPILQWLKKH